MRVAVGFPNARHNLHREEGRKKVRSGRRFRRAVGRVLRIATWLCQMGVGAQTTGAAQAWWFFFLQQKDTGAIASFR